MPFLVPIQHLTHPKKIAAKKRQEEAQHAAEGQIEVEMEEAK
jgi:hypothetical protein